MSLSSSGCRALRQLFSTFPVMEDFNNQNTWASFVCICLDLDYKDHDLQQAMQKVSNCPLTPLARLSWRTRGHH